MSTDHFDLFSPPFYYTLDIKSNVSYKQFALQFNSSLIIFFLFSLGSEGVYGGAETTTGGWSSQSRGCISCWSWHFLPCCRWWEKCPPTWFSHFPSGLQTDGSHSIFFFLFQSLRMPCWRCLCHIQTPPHLLYQTSAAWPRMSRSLMLCRCPCKDQEQVKHGFWIFWISLTK